MLRFLSVRLIMFISNGVPVNFYKILILVGNLSGCLIFASMVNAGERSDLDGVWNLVYESARDSVLSGTPPIIMTREGAEKNAAYDFLQDDPLMRCIPPSISRVMLTPSPLFEIRQHEAYVEINYEFMDVKRRIPLDAALDLPNAPLSVPEYPHLGRSVGRYEGEELVIETMDIGEGVFSTHVLVGYYQSDEMKTTERFIPDGDLLEVRITHVDPVYYEEPFDIVYRHHRTESPLLHWGCEPEKACVDPRLCSP